MPADGAKRAARTPTRELILDEVERLIAVKGVFGFTLRDVAEPLRVRVPAIYKHFENRDDVLIEVSRRFITLLAEQFCPDPALDAADALHGVLDRFVEFMLEHPAYVRLALIDFATPDGGMEYVKRASGGSFGDNFSTGPLAPMHARLRSLLRSGARAKHFRAVDATDFYRVIKSALLIRLVFPSDALLLRRASRADLLKTQRWLGDIADALLAPRAVRVRGRRRLGSR